MLFMVYNNCPGQQRAPDLSPIGHIWDMTKRELTLSPEPATTGARYLGQSIIWHLHDHMHVRIHACIAARGVQCVLMWIVLAPLTVTCDSFGLNLLSYTPTTINYLSHQFSSDWSNLCVYCYFSIITNYQSPNWSRKTVRYDCTNLLLLLPPFTRIEELTWSNYARYFNKGKRISQIFSNELRPTLWRTVPLLHLSRIVCYSQYTFSVWIVCFVDYKMKSVDSLVITLYLGEEWKEKSKWNNWGGIHLTWL